MRVVFDQALILRTRPLQAAAIAACCCVAAVGCGFGEGERAEGDAHLAVTRDFGSKRLVEATSERPSESETVVRMLDRVAEIETSYGGNFVDTIDGLSGSTASGGDSDWFFFVNGYFSEVGAGEARVTGGDEVWWDYHRWEGTYETPAVVGSWPQPFLAAVDPVIGCATRLRLCDRIAARLRAQGVEPKIASDGYGANQLEEGTVRILVGQWSRLSDQPAAAKLAGPTSRSGVYARFEPPDGSTPSLDRRASDPDRATDSHLLVFDDAGRLVSNYGEGVGLIAATADLGGPATWLVTGLGKAGVVAAVDAFGPDLRDKFAILVEPGESKGIGLPMIEPGP